MSDLAIVLDGEIRYYPITDSEPGGMADYQP